MKEELRRSFLKRRDELSINELQKRSSSIHNRLLQDKDYREGKTILFYVSFKSEVLTIPLLKMAFWDKRVIVPITHREKKILILSHLKDLCELKESTYGIKEPRPEFIRPFPYHGVDLVLVPGVVFDKRGYRIGYGGGYYDRLLVELKPVVKRIGLAFEIQLVEELSPQVHDKPVHKIITEERTISIGEGI